MKKILVVDDDVDILYLMQMILSTINYRVEAIGRWEDIDDYIKNFGPDLILLDVYHAGADGRELCKKIKQTKNTGHIPVILFSANPELGNNFRDWLAEDFLDKPFELSHLLKTLNLYLN